MKNLRETINNLDFIEAYPKRPEQDILDDIQNTKRDINNILDSVEETVGYIYDVLEDLNSTSLLDLDIVLEKLEEVKNSLY